MIQLLIDAMNGQECEPVGFEAWQAWRICR